MLAGLSRYLLVVLVAVSLLSAGVHAAEMHVMESLPSAHATMTGRSTEFFIRFDGPVDHGASLLEVLRDGRVVQTLRPRLNSQPNTLYSGVKALPPGSYELHWTVRSAREHDASSGTIPFEVAATK